MKVKSNRLIIIFLLIGLSIPIIIVGKSFYKQNTFSSDKTLRTQLIEKVSKLENISPQNIEIVKIDSHAKEKIKYVVVFYKTADDVQKAKTFRYYQAVFGRINVGKEFK